ncbi:MAG TPA: FtsX-like permease family protein, partial [Gemmatimonadaceae bacterium]
SLNTLGETHLDWRAVVLALGLSVVTGVVFGLTAALHSIRKTSGESLRATSLTGTATVTRHRLRSLLVVTEMALSAMLLVGAVLLVRSVRNMQRIDVHFDPANLYSLELMLPPARYPKLEANLAMLGQMLERTRHLPSVVGATLANATPPDANYMLSHPESADGKTLPNSSFTSFNAVAPEYFDLLGLRFLRGRTFSPGVGAAAEIIINEGFAQKMWPGEDAIGKRIRFASADTSKPEPWKTVIGVVPNVPMLGLAGDPAKPMFYLDHRTASFLGSVRILVRARPGMDPTAAMKSAVLEVDPRATPPSVETITNALSESIASQRFTMKLLAVFAVLAVVLSAVGLYGVISFVVTQRTREIGIRMALGALPADVARAVAARGLALSLVGLSIGLVGAVWGTKLIKTALFGVTGTDAMSYAATGAALLAVSIIASLVPMRRAMRVDPVIAMRGE